jgi:hypothetical protein
VSTVSTHYKYLVTGEMSTVLPGNTFQISGYWLGIYGINTLHHLLTGKMSTVLRVTRFKSLVTG